MMHAVYNVKIVSKGVSRYRYWSLCGVGIKWLNINVLVHSYVDVLE